jgi:outer membrane protein
MVGAARAETLADALTLAYQANPTLLSQRAQLQATDEGYVQAEAGYRPTVNLQGTASYTKSPQPTLFGGVNETEANSGSGALSLTQPIYTGGRVTSAVNVAKAQIMAGREQLRGVEANVLFNAIQAYCDVLRDRASLKIQRGSLAALQDATDEIRARYKSGANTATDASQAEAQLEAGRALVYSAQAQLEVSNAEYVAAVGQSPGELSPPPPLPAMPTSVDNAFDISEGESPVIRQARFTEAANRAQVQQARAATRPTVSLNAAIGSAGLVVPLSRTQYERTAQATVTFTQPLFTGGLTSSQIREAVAQDNSARLQIEAARRTAIQTVSQAWSQSAAARLNTVADAAEVTAAQATFDGIRVEYRAGLRQTLDVLIAQETLRDAQIALEAAKHDEYVASALLLNAVGRLEARVLLQGQPLYQPQVSFRRNEAKNAVPWEIAPKVLDQLGGPPLRKSN